MQASERIVAAVLLAAPAVVLGDLWVTAEEQDVEPTITTLTRERLPEIEEAFDAGNEGPRMIVFFSSACSACDAGSAALQEMLEKHAGPVTVVAVWQPIAPTDPAPPPSFVDNLRDHRVVQLWDPEHLLSNELRASEIAHPGSPPQSRLRTDGSPTGILYDTIAIFPPGLRWEATLPAPDWLDGGVSAVLGDARVWLNGYHASRRPSGPATSRQAPPR